MLKANESLISIGVSQDVRVAGAGMEPRLQAQVRSLGPGFARRDAARAVEVVGYRPREG